MAIPILEIKVIEAKSCFLKDIYWFIQFDIEILLIKLFLISSNVKVNFVKLKISYKTCVSTKVILITKQVKSIGKKKWKFIVFYPEKESYKIKRASFASFNLQFYFLEPAQIRLW